MYVDIYVCMFIPMCLCGHTHATACTGDNLQCLSSPSTLSEIGPQVGYSGIIRLADPQVSPSCYGRAGILWIPGIRTQVLVLEWEVFPRFLTGVKQVYGKEHVSRALLSGFHSLNSFLSANIQSKEAKRILLGHFLAADCQHCRLFCLIFDMYFFF